MGNPRHKGPDCPAFKMYAFVGNGKTQVMGICRSMRHLFCVGRFSIGCYMSSSCVWNCVWKGVNRNQLTINVDEEAPDASMKIRIETNTSYIIDINPYTTFMMRAMAALQLSLHMAIRRTTLANQSWISIGYVFQVFEMVLIVIDGLRQRSMRHCCRCKP